MGINSRRCPARSEAKNKALASRTFFLYGKVQLGSAAKGSVVIGSIHSAATVFPSCLEQDSFGFSSHFSRVAVRRLFNLSYIQSVTIS